MILQPRALAKADAWKTLFERFKPIITSHIPVTRLNHGNTPAIFINEAELFDKDEEALIQSKAKSMKSNINQESRTDDQFAQNTRKSVMREPQEPIRPDPEDCCGDGCKVCVFDRYYQELEKYEDELAKWNKLQKSQANLNEDSTQSKISEKQHLKDLEW